MRPAITIESDEGGLATSEIGQSFHPDETQLPINVYEYSDIPARAAQQGATLKFQYGFWGVILGFMAVIVGGAWDVISQSKRI